MNLKAKYNTILNKKVRANIRKRFAEVFGVSDPTIFSWLGGRSNPPKRYHSTIATIMGMEVSELFPNTDTDSEVTTETANAK
ncbi:MAG: hypothetical protein K6F33_00260 [Bacteroidales bacterium]|nr:hypothetical protein [Bacteroidales bacterium]